MLKALYKGQGRELDAHNMHVESSNIVALQTAQVQIAGKGTSRVRVPFDSASHKSFVTSRVAKSFGLDPIRRDWLTVNIFSQRARGSNLRDVVQINLTPVVGGKDLPTEVFIVPEISRVQSEHLEIVRRDYLHLAQR